MSKMAWKDVDKTKIFNFCESYIRFLNNSKTERLCTQTIKKIIESNDYKCICEFDSLKSGDKVYKINRDKSIIMAKIGDEMPQNGMNIIASHIDSPRLDLKPVPLYEDSEFALFKTHYYGGIKKYQWMSIPLSLIGVVIKENGEKINISIGEDESDPVFTITDLLPHLAQDQMSKKVSELFTGEDLNVLIGSLPSDEEKDAVKDNILKLLEAKYGICEEDFISSELELVPSFKAKNVGFDSSFVGSYGQDDRICAYTSLIAMIDASKTTKTTVCYFADKEEIGSMGNTGTKSMFFESFLASLINLTKENYSDIDLKNAFEKSMCLSADVTVAFDPNYKNVCEPLNSAYAGGGVCMSKYTGSRGKSSTSDANAEFVAKVRGIFNRNNVKWQIAELGKVDQGGGGTVAQYIANLNIDTLDCGVPILAMHSPFEVSSKLDVYMAYLGYKAFFEA